MIFDIFLFFKYITSSEQIVLSIAFWKRTIVRLEYCKITLQDYELCSKICFIL